VRHKDPRYSVGIDSFAVAVGNIAMHHS
jgi:hypothetical protein